MARTTSRTSTTSPATGGIVSPKVTPAQLRANAAARAARVNGGTPKGTATKDQAIAQANATPARTRKASTAPAALTAPARPTRTRKATPAPATPAKATPAKVPATRQLPRDLLVASTVWAVATYGKDQASLQRVANYLKVVTSGSAVCGCRWWPTKGDLPKGTAPLPRPTHFSWDCPHGN